MHDVVLIMDYANSNIDVIMIVRRGDESMCKMRSL